MHIPPDPAWQARRAMQMCRDGPFIRTKGADLSYNPDLKKPGWNSFSLSTPECKARTGVQSFGV